MLKFDDTHKSLNGSIEKKTKKRYFNPKLLIGNILLSMVVLFSGCAKTVDCDINVPHAHVYVNEEGFKKNIISEKESKWGFIRTNDYFQVSEQEKELVDFIYKNDLMDITQNTEAIKKITDSHKDYLEYRYSYIYMQPIPHIHSNGKTTYTTFSYIPIRRYSWTSTPNRSGLTGETRTVHHMYYGYKIETDNKGKLKVIKSELVDDLNDLPADYLYIKKDFTTKVYANNKKKEIDYEDGQEENNDEIEKNIDQKVKTLENN